MLYIYIIYSYRERERERERERQRERERERGRERALIIIIPSDVGFYTVWAVPKTVSVIQEGVVYETATGVEAGSGLWGLGI